MKATLVAEYVGLFCLALFLFSQLDYSWWLYSVLFFVPSVGMLGYLVYKKLGAFTYNALHHQGVAVALYLGGVFLGNPLLLLGGVVLLGHANFDRIAGYGLKYSDSFHHTHIGNLR